MDNMILEDKDELKGLMTEVAQELVLAEATLLNELGKGKRKIRVHADGSRQIRRQGVSAGQKTKNASGRSVGKRKRSAVKTLRTKLKKFGKAIATRTAKLIKRAKGKRKARGL
jgi:hypothetical protein